MLQTTCKLIGHKQLRPLNITDVKEPLNNHTRNKVKCSQDLEDLDVVEIFRLAQVRFFLYSDKSCLC